jgi:Ser/Thr protein kinase RdoA (MazF antagonist)
LEALAHVLRTHYGLTLLEAVHIDYGMWEESFRADTDQGRFFAKRFLRKERQTDYMLRGIQLSQKLRAQGVPAPRVLPPALALTDDGARYQVTEWVDGRCYHPGELPDAAVAPMGALLGRLHRLLGPGDVQPPAPLPTPAEGARQCRALLTRYEDRPETFAAVAREVLEDQIALLEAIPADFTDRLPLPALGGPVFNSYWVEQLLFRPDGQVAALIDWTDGAGKPGLWTGDLALGIHLSALTLPQAVAFAEAYQSEHPLPEQEWRALAADLCYGHLASTNFLAGCFARPYRRMADWEVTSAIWHRQICPRFRAWPEWEAALLAVSLR